MSYFRFKIKQDGPTYEFDPSRDITLQGLRSVKGWYGTLGTFNNLNTGFGQGDPDAIASVVWICRRKAGEQNVPDPQAMEDICIGDFYNSFEFVPDQEDPTGSAGSVLNLDQTDDSTQIQTNSTDDIAA